MIKKTFISILYTCIFLFPAILAFGQDASQPQLFFVEDVIIKPSEGNNFQKVLQEFIDIFKEHKFKFRVNSYMTDDFHFYGTYPINDFADVGNLFSDFNNLSGMIGEPGWSELMEREYKCIESVEYGLYYFRPDLSYLPENPRLTEEEAKYNVYEFFYTHSGMEAEAEATWKEWIKLYNEKGIADPFYTWVGFIGPEIPVYIFIMTAKDAVDYYEADAAIMEKLGNIDALSEKTLKLSKKIEYKSGKILSELSFIPESE